MSDVRRPLGTTERLISELKIGNPGTESALMYRTLDFAHAQGWINGETWDSARRCVEVGAVESAAFAMIPDGWSLFLSQFTGSIASGWNADLLSIRGTPPDLDQIKVWGIAATPALALTIACCRAYIEEASREST